MVWERQEEVIVKRSRITARQKTELHWPIGLWFCEIYSSVLVACKRLGIAGTFESNSRLRLFRRFCMGLNRCCVCFFFVCAVGILQPSSSRKAWSQAVWQSLSDGVSVWLGLSRNSAPPASFTRGMCAKTTGMPLFHTSTCVCEREKERHGNVQAA